ncbi:MAG: T9SS C-terminal target domain-containing protein [Bacteroidetes bacterium]|nr:MAG: T9SS C-terminal target domain-containing protein [Bacteroidota bacterium]REK00405.1 MAG: T9SS C-terminal target domain-containing protein [Bacteroidota bacterium]REK35524.1 MAG: T9SS C-terminal target domain-containing protein [Bacteroidota bacterium]REK49064.1 MAG: T9SS C-terminal target domain-containing protein [Bacteroidota bacterium]
MKKTFMLTILFNFLYNTIIAQSWQWSLHEGSVYEERVLSLTKDVMGNVFTSGQFGYGPSLLGSAVIAGDTLYIEGASDIFIASYDIAGNPKWAKRAGGNSPNHAEYGYLENCLFDSSIIAFGTYHSYLSVDTFFLQGDPYFKNLFLGKIDQNGKFLWLKKAANANDGNSITQLSCDNFGNAYLMGTTVAGATLDTINISAGGYIAKINSDGHFLWAKRVFDYTKTNGWKINATSNGFIASGFFIESTQIDTALIYSNGLHDFFIASFDSMGNILWIKTIGWHGTDVNSAFDIDITGNIYVSGYFTDSIYFDTTLLTHGGKDVFLAKFDPQGNFLWARQLFANGDAESNDIDVDDQGNVYITGYFNLQATFGGNTVTATAYPSMFLARYNALGDFLGMRYFGSARGTNVVSDGNSVVVAGTFTNSVTLDNTTLTSNGLTDMFLAKHDAFVGVGELSLQRNRPLSIYANPSNGHCNIDIPEEFLNETNLLLTIYDQQGRKVRDYLIEMNEGKIRLNLQEEAKGIYIATLNNGKKQYTGKIVFE